MVLRVHQLQETHIPSSQVPDPLAFDPLSVFVKEVAHLREGMTVPVGVVAADGGRVHNPVIAMLVEVVDQLEGHSTNQFIITVDDYLDFVIVAVVEGAVDDIVSREVSLQVLHVDDLLRGVVLALDEAHGLVKSLIF